MLKSFKKVVLVFALFFMISESNCFASVSKNNMEIDSLFRNDASIESIEDVPKINKEQESVIEKSINEEVKNVVEENNTQKIETTMDIEDNENLFQQEINNQKKIDNENKNFISIVICFFVIVFSIIVGIIVTNKNLKKYK